MSASTLSNLRRAVGSPGMSETVADAVRATGDALETPSPRGSMSQWFCDHHGESVTVIEANSSGVWSFERQVIDADSDDCVKLTSAGVYVRQEYKGLSVVHADAATLIVDGDSMSLAYVIYSRKPDGHPLARFVESIGVPVSVDEPETDYTADDAKRLLAIGISDDRACGYCTGGCGSCQQEAAEVVAKIRAEALREVVEVARAEIPVIAFGDSDYRRGMIYGQNRFAAWLAGRR